MSNNWLMLDTTMMIDDWLMMIDEKTTHMTIHCNHQQHQQNIKCAFMSFMFIVHHSLNKQQTTNNKQQQLHSSTTTCKQNTMTNFITKHPHTLRWIDWCVCQNIHNTHQHQSQNHCCVAQHPPHTFIPFVHHNFLNHSLVHQSLVSSPSHSSTTSTHNTSNINTSHNFMQNTQTTHCFYFTTSVWLLPAQNTRISSSVKQQMHDWHHHMCSFSTWLVCCCPLFHLTTWCFVSHIQWQPQQQPQSAFPMHHSWTHTTTTLVHSLNHLMLCAIKTHTLLFSACVQHLLFVFCSNQCRFTSSNHQHKISAVLVDTACMILRSASIFLMQNNVLICVW